jgi:hypothetical protein
MEKRVINILELNCIVFYLLLRKRNEQKWQELRNKIDHETARISTIRHPN